MSDEDSEILSTPGVPVDDSKSVNVKCQSPGNPLESQIKPVDQSPDAADQRVTVDPVERMLVNLIIHDNAHFRHQTRDEKPLSDAQKLTIARDLYSQKPGVFLERFSQYLDWPQDRINFTKWHKSDDLIGYLIQKLDRESELNAALKSKISASRVRNRRLHALYRVARGDVKSAVADHFTHEAMRQRDPVLWETMIGQHLDGPTRRRYLDREYETFSEYLHGQLMEKEEQECLSRARRAQDGRESETVEDKLNDGKSHELDSDQEREFIDLMKIRFIAGQDKNFDYRVVDNDDTLDDDDPQTTVDEEEKYFDGD